MNVMEFGWIVADDLVVIDGNMMIHGRELLGVCLRFTKNETSNIVSG